MYYFGIDGGGSNSRIAAIDVNGGFIGDFKGKTTNLAANDYDTVLDNISRLVSGLCNELSISLADCCGLCIGTAGIGSVDNIGKLERIFDVIGLKAKLTIVNDAAIVLFAATKGKPGIAIISGTGSIGYALDKDGNSLRSGGWGHLIDDAGSGYYIGMAAIRRALMAFDKRGHDTALMPMIMSHFGLNSMDEVLNIVYAPGFTKAKAATLALIVSAAAENGDKAAQDIEEEAAISLSLLASALIKRSGLDDRPPISLSGSVIVKNPRINSRFTQEILHNYPNALIKTLDISAELGAAHLARESENETFFKK